MRKKFQGMGGRTASSYGLRFGSPGRTPAPLRARSGGATRQRGPGGARSGHSAPCGAARRRSAARKPRETLQWQRAQPAPHTAAGLRTRATRRAPWCPRRRSRSCSPAALRHSPPLARKRHAATEPHAQVTPLAAHRTRPQARRAYAAAQAPREHAGSAGRPAAVAAARAAVCNALAGAHHAPRGPRCAVARRSASPALPATGQEGTAVRQASLFALSTWLIRVLFAMRRLVRLCWRR
jgi:hypothetical protein